MKFMGFACKVDAGNEAKGRHSRELHRRAVVHNIMV